MKEETYFCKTEGTGNELNLCVTDLHYLGNESEDDVLDFDDYHRHHQV